MEDPQCVKVHRSGHQYNQGHSDLKDHSHRLQVTLLRRTGLRDDLLRHPRQNARHHEHRLRVTLPRTGLRDDHPRHLRQNALPRHHSHHLQATLPRTGLRDGHLRHPRQNALPRHHSHRLQVTSLELVSGMITFAILVKMLSLAIIAIAFR